MKKNILEHDAVRGYHEPEDEKEIEVTYKFYLPTHEYELGDFANGHVWRAVVNDIYTEIRNMSKYGHKHTTADAMLEHIREFMSEAMTSRGVDFN